MRIATHVVSHLLVLGLSGAPLVASEPLLPPGTVVVPVDVPLAAPTWAVKQRRLLERSAEVTRRMDRLCFREDGSFRGEYVHGGGHLAPDDTFEFGGKGPLLYALGADDVVLTQWWRMYQASLRQCREQRLFVNDMSKFLDWHHNGEHYQSFWTAALCMPHEPLYRELLLKYAGFYDGTNPAVPNYDPQHKVVRSILHGGAGPIRVATRADWDAKESPFWDDWLQCGHDGPINLVVTNWGTLAYMLTGDERHRRTALEYLDAWRERARNNGGLIPSIVNADGRVPKEWWGGVMGWDFQPFGGLFQVSSGPRAGWANALLLTRGDASYYDSLRTLADAVWNNRRTDARGQLYLPRYVNAGGWHGRMGDNSMEGIYANIRANIYLATMRPDDLARVLECPIEGRAGHEDFHEGGREGRWIRFLQGQNPKWPDEALDDNLDRVERQIAWFERHLADPALSAQGPALWIQWRVGAGYCASLVQSMTGGVMPLWHGQLLLARFRYFDPHRKRPGLPSDCAALVESITEDSATLVLVNTHATEPRTVLVQTGAYAEHRCLSVAPERTGGSNTAPVPVHGSHFAVRLGPGAGQRMIVRMKRYAHDPTLRWPWSERN